MLYAAVLTTAGRDTGDLAYSRRAPVRRDPHRTAGALLGEDPSKPGPWLEIVGIVQDEGMTPTDFGEGPYVDRAVSAATASPMVIAVRTKGDPASFAPRLCDLAAGVDPALRIDEMRTLEDFGLREETPGLIFTGSGAAVVVLGLLLSAAGIFSLMSVTVPRRTGEIGLRSALGASPQRLIAGIFKRAVVLIGGGIAVGNLVIILAAILSADLSARYRRRAYPRVRSHADGRIIGLHRAGEARPAHPALRTRSG